MKKIYVAENPALVWKARRIVEAAGIRCVLRNEYAGGASGLLSPLDAWPELWVVDPQHAERAARLLADTAAAAGRGGPDWRCAECGESNDPSFDLCWRCGSAAP